MSAIYLGGKRMKEEMEQKPEESQNESQSEFVEKELEQSLAQQVNIALGVEEPLLQLPKKRKKMKRWKIALIVIGGILLLFGALIYFFVFFKPGRDKMLHDIVAPELHGKVFIYDDSTNVGSGKKNNKDDATTQKGSDKEKPEQDVVNILLVGVEELFGARNTDTMIIASMNRKTNELSITSLMRDLYVEIPGHEKNKLNAAYAQGGMQLLYDTIETNLGVTMDGYMSINFDAFERFIDLLGGIEITLNKKEAYYLNHTNYISNPIYKTVVEGTQTVNGNQALGYCRIRKVTTGKENDDYGRTARQRAVLTAIYQKLMKKDLLELVNFMNDVFDEIKITTDIPVEDFSDYLTEVVEINVNELKQYRIPAKNMFTEDSVKLPNIKKKQDVLIPKDWEATRKALYEYIYGSTTEVGTQIGE